MAKVSLQDMFVRARSNSHSERQSSRIRELGNLAEYSERHHVIARAQSRAMRNYKLKPYGGRLTLFRARMQPFFYCHDPDNGWSRVAAGGLEIKTVPGNHLAMLQEPHVRVFARELKACLANYL
jgi:thioesterase domain-containing protein